MVNKVILVGNVGQAPEVRATPNGKRMATISIATSERYKDRSGERKEKTEWHRVVVFGDLVDDVDKSVKKGSKLYIEGAMQTRKWKDKKGVERYTTEVLVGGYKGVLLVLGDATPAKREKRAPSKDDDIPF